MLRRRWGCAARTSFLTAATAAVGPRRLRLGVEVLGSLHLLAKRLTEHRALGLLLLLRVVALVLHFRRRRQRAGGLEALLLALLLRRLGRVAATLARLVLARLAVRFPANSESGVLCVCDTSNCIVSSNSN